MAKSLCKLVKVQTGQIYIKKVPINIVFGIIISILNIYKYKRGRQIIRFACIFLPMFHIRTQFLQEFIKTNKGIKRKVAALFSLC